jgi:hypothetical protein
MASSSNQESRNETSPGDSPKDAQQDKRENKSILSRLKAQWDKLGVNSRLLKTMFK